MIKNYNEFICDCCGREVEHLIELENDIQCCESCSREKIIELFKQQNHPMVQLSILKGTEIYDDDGDPIWVKYSPRFDYYYFSDDKETHYNLEEIIDAYIDILSDMFWLDDADFATKLDVVNESHFLNY